MTTATRQEMSFDPSALQRGLDGSYAELRGQLSDAVPSREEKLLEREHQLDLFRWREGHITASVAARFRRGLDEGYDAFEVFRAVQDHAVAAARAHVDRIVLEAFAAAIESRGEDTVKAALSQLCDLYALQNIEADKGFFREHGRLAALRCKAITREVNRLRNEVRGQAAALVDSFGIPDQLIAAPIGTREETP